MENFELGKDVSHVIDRTASLENLLNQVIIKCASPPKEKFDFFWDVILDSSIMPLGSKIKVVLAISENMGFKVSKDKLHKLVSYRNAFAHHPLASHTTFIVGKEPDEDRVDYMLHILLSSGKTDRKSRKEALIEFDKHFKIVKKELISLRDKI